MWLVQANMQKREKGQRKDMSTGQFLLSQNSCFKVGAVSLHLAVVLASHAEGT